MTKPTHINIGFTVLLLLILYNSQFSIFMLLTPFLSVLPDIDHPQGFLSKKLHLKKILSATGVKHRGITHTLLFPIVVASIIYAIGLYGFNYQFSRWDIIVLIALILSHILGDIFTVRGIQAFYPLPFLKNITLKTPLSISTGKTEEHMFSFFIMLINFYLFSLLIHKGLFIDVYNSFLSYYHQHPQIVLYSIIFIIIANFYLFSKEILTKNANEKIGGIISLLFNVIISIIVLLISLYYISKLYPQYILYYIIGAGIFIIYLIIYFISNIKKLKAQNRGEDIFKLGNYLESFIKNSFKLFVYILMSIIIVGIVSGIIYYFIPQYYMYILGIGIIFVIIGVYLGLKKTVENIVPNFVYMLIGILYILLALYTVYLGFNLY